MCQALVNDDITASFCFVVITFNSCSWAVGSKTICKEKEKIKTFNLLFLVGCEWVVKPFLTKEKLQFFVNLFVKLLHFKIFQYFELLMPL